MKALNAENYISSQLEKLRSQAYPINEIVVDSESNDNTVDICQNYGVRLD